MALVAPAIVSTTAFADDTEPTTVDVFLDFEDDSNGPGYEPYGSGGAGTHPIDHFGGNFKDGPNEFALELGYDTTSDPYYGGINWVAPAGSPWDWTRYDGIELWVYGDQNATGSFIQVELADASGPGTPELFDFNIPIDFAGWSHFRIPFEDITFATDHQNDWEGDNKVLDLDAISALSLTGNDGNALVGIDDIALYAGGVVPASVGLGNVASPFEGEDVTVDIQLNKAADDDVTVDYATVDGTAVAGTDYEAISGTATIPAGETSVSLTVSTIDNDITDGNRTFEITLSNAEGASLGAASRTVTIRDNDAADGDKLTLLHQVSEDFEEDLIYTPNDPAGAVPMGWTSEFGGGNVPTVDQVIDDTVPGASADNQVLDVALDLSSWTALIYRFTEDGETWSTQDWAQNYSVGFWMLGTNSGANLFIDVLDNRNAGSTTDDAERWSHPFVDDFLGWQFIELPLSDFMRKDTGNGAPNDGFTLSDVHGFAIGNEPGTGTLNVRFDDFVVIAFQEKVEDFEQPLPEGTGTPPVGWVVDGSDTPPAYDQIADDSHPLALSDNTVLSVDVSEGGWGALVRAFGEGATWTSQDWSSYTGIGFWFKGENTGNTYGFDILDNRNAGSTVDDAERFSADFVDDSTDWKFVELPFSSFARKDVGNGAPNDGFGRTDVHGFAFVHVDATPTTFLVDDVTLVGSAERAALTVSFNGQQFYVTEGEDTEVAVRLNRAPETALTVGYKTVEQPVETTSRFAVPGRDYVESTGEITFEAGQRDAIIAVPTISDGKPEANETFSIALTEVDDPEVLINPAAATVTILNVDDADPLLVEEFEYGVGAVGGLGDTQLNVREIADTDADAYEGQYEYDHVLDVSGADAGITRDYVVPQDWSAGEGLGFWYKGTGSGETVTAHLRDAEASGDADTELELVWSDEFDGAEGTPPNPAYWNAEINGHGWGNQELQYYTDSTDNAAHNGEGQMVITMRAIEDQEAFQAEQAAKGHPTSCHYGDCQFTSARYNTYGKVNFLYGRVEARSQLPDGKNGIWPAIWALGDIFFEGTDWPMSGEIDIMEFVGKQPREIFGTVHGPGYNGGNAIHGIHDFTDELEPGDTLGKKWMRFAIEWEEDEIRWYVALDSAEDVEDGEWHHFHTATREQADSLGEWVFDEPEFLIMNFAVGGNFGGPLAPDLEFPQEFLIDYIRIFQPVTPGDTYEYSFSDDEEGWRFIELPFDGFEEGEGLLRSAATGDLDVSNIAGFALTLPGLDGATVSLDRIQVLSEITDATPPASDDGDDDDGGTGGDDDDDPTLPETGVDDGWVYLLLVALMLGAAGSVLVVRRREDGAI